MVDAASIKAAQHNCALWPGTIALQVCFAGWAIFSVIGVRIKQERGVNDTEFGPLAGTPILTRSALGIPFGAPMTAVFSKSPNSNRGARRAC